MSNYFEEMMKFQKNLFNPWQNVYSKEKEINENENYSLSLSEYFKWMAKINQAMVREAYQFPNTFSNAIVDSKIFDHNMFTAFNPQKSFWENMMNYNKMFMENMSSPVDMLKKMQTNFNAFKSAKDVYDEMTSKDFDIKNINESLKNWRNSYIEYVKEILIPMAPEELRPFMENNLSYVNKGIEFYDKTFNPMIEDINKFGVFDGPMAYFENLNTIQKEYFEKLKTINPDFKYNEKLQNLVEKSLDGAKSYNEVLGKYLQKIFEISKDASSKAIKDFEKQVKEGMEPRSFEEFYNYLVQKVKDYSKDAMEAKEIKELFNEYKNAFEQYSKDSEKVMKDYYISFKQPVVKDDVVKLENRIEELSKEVERLTNELKKK